MSMLARAMWCFSTVAVGRTARRVPPMNPPRAPRLTSTVPLAFLSRVRLPRLVKVEVLLLPVAKVAGAGDG